MPRHIVFALAVLLLAAAPAASAEDVIEAYRSPFGIFRWASVDQTDGTCWVSSGGSLLQLGPIGEVLRQTNGFAGAGVVAVDSSDGSCWVTDTYRMELVHVAADGAELARVPDVCPRTLAVNPADGSCWAFEDWSLDLVHLAADGSELGRLAGVEAKEIAVSPVDGSLWLLTHETVRRLAQNGRELWRVTANQLSADLFDSIALDPADGSCWVAGSVGGLIRLDEHGEELWRIGGRYRSVSGSPADGSCWGVEPLGSGHSFEAVHIARDGTELGRSASQSGRSSGLSIVSAGAPDGSCWIIYEIHQTCLNEGESLLHLASDGAEIWRGQCLPEPAVVAADPADGSCWVAFHANGAAQLAQDGTELRRVWGTPSDPISMSVNPTDHSWWIGGSSRVTHFSADGDQLLDPVPICGLRSLSVNPADGSCWVAGHYATPPPFSPEDEQQRTGLHQPEPLAHASVGPVDFPDGSSRAAYIPDYSCEVVAHLAEDGTELWRRDDWVMFSVSVNPLDGSCYAKTRNEIIRLAEDGTILWQVPASFGMVCADPTDGSCWVSCGGSAGFDITHLSPQGEELWRGGDGSLIRWGVSVSPLDGSCWASGSVHYSRQGWPHRTVVHIGQDGTELWRGEDFAEIASLSAAARDGCCWVADRRNRQVVLLVVVGTPAMPFRDMPAGCWASDEIYACSQAGIVSGYPDGAYRPDWPVTRAQMAVYIARALAGGDENVPDFTGTPSFRDVTRWHWASDYVEYAVEQNVVEGYGDGLYHPEYEVTRDEMAVYVARSLVAPEGDVGLADYVPADPRNFPDVASDFWSYKHVEYCVENGVVAGYLDGLYHPEIVVTRDQMAVYVARAFGLAH